MDHESSHRQRSERIGEYVSIYSRGSCWYANFQYAGKQHRQSLETRSKKEARRRALKLDGQLVEGRYQRPAAVPSIDAVIQDYMAFLRAERRAKKTLVKYEKVFDRLRELAGRKRVTKISGVDLRLVDAYRSDRAAKCASKTVHTETVVIKQLVNFAVSRGLLATNPLRGLRIKKPKSRPQPCWTREQVTEILAASREGYRAALTLLAETGMRVGELKHLQWDDIDFPRNVIRVQPKQGWRPKTGDQRAIPISPATRAVLQQLPRQASRVVTAPPSKFSDAQNRPVCERRLLDHLKRVLKRLGLPGHLHTFRHAFISNALTEGTAEAVVRAWVGHVDAEVLKLYTHIADRASQAAMEDLSRRGDTKQGREAEKTSPSTSGEDSPSGADSKAVGEEAQKKHNRRSP